MIIGDRLRLLRDSKSLSQGDIEKRTGLMRSYISRVENGHSIPAIETLEKFARAMDMQLYQLLYDGPEPPQLPKPSLGKASRDEWAGLDKEARFLKNLRRYLSKLTPHDRQVLMVMVSQLVKTRDAAKSAMKGSFLMKTKPSNKLKDGARCSVIGGKHAGKSGVVRDIKTGKTGYVSITVVQANGERFKTLGKNVVIVA